jgi:hypothetical protein
MKNNSDRRYFTGPLWLLASPDAKGYAIHYAGYRTCDRSLGSASESRICTNISGDIRVCKTVNPTTEIRRERIKIT